MADSKLAVRMTLNVTEFTKNLKLTQKQNEQREIVTIYGKNLQFVWVVLANAAAAIIAQMAAK